MVQDLLIQSAVANNLPLVTRGYTYASLCIDYKPSLYILSVDRRVPRYFDLIVYFRCFDYTEKNIFKSLFFVPNIFKMIYFLLIFCKQINMR